MEANNLPPGLPQPRLDHKVAIPRQRRPSSQNMTPARATRERSTHVSKAVSSCGVHRTCANNMKVYTMPETKLAHLYPFHAT